MSSLAAIDPFAAQPVGYCAGYLPLTVSIFADRSVLTAELAEDALAAGFRLGQRGSLEALLASEACGLGEVILVDAPAVDAAALAALARLDIRAARSGAQLVVSTSLAALDGVFGCLDQSGAQILVAPTRAERMIALGRVLAAMPQGRVRELSDADRVTMLRLTEQVSQLAERIERLADGTPAARLGTSPRLASPGRGWRGPPADAGASGKGGERRKRAPRPPLPDPRLVRKIIHQRQLRARFFDAELFADPAWDILLDLTAARAEHQRVSVSSLCIASAVPPTTALRWIGQMTEAGLLERVEDPCDRRRAFIALSDRAADGMARYFVELGRDAERLA